MNGKTDPVTEIDGAAIRAERKARGMSQTKFGEYLGVHRNTVGNWEKDIEIPLMVKRLVLAEGLMRCLVAPPADG